MKHRSSKEKAVFEPRDSCTMIVNIVANKSSMRFKIYAVYGEIKGEREIYEVLCAIMYTFDL